MPTKKTAKPKVIVAKAVVAPKPPVKQSNERKAKVVAALKRLHPMD